MSKLDSFIPNHTSSTSQAVVCAFASVFVVTLCSLVTIAAFPGINGRRRVLISFFIAFSVGCLIGDVAFHLLPELNGISEGSNRQTSLVISICFLTGMYLFFWMEKYLQTFHHGHQHSNRNELCSQPSDYLSHASTNEYVPLPATNSTHSSIVGEQSLNGAPTSVNLNNSMKYFKHVCSGSLGDVDHEGSGHISAHRLDPLVYSVLAGDFLHNFIDGIAIGASFLVSFRTGITTAVAILFHEIPHELADYAVLVGSGISRLRAFWYCALSNTSAFLGILPAFLLGKHDQWRQVVLSFTAGVFLYIALADLIPELLHKHSHGSSNQANDEADNQQGQSRTKETLLQHGGIIVGCALMMSIRFFE